MKQTQLQYGRNEKKIVYFEFQAITPIHLDSGEKLDSPSFEQKKKENGAVVKTCAPGCY
jgi:hypothetical protein